MSEKNINNENENENEVDNEIDDGEIIYTLIDEDNKESDFVLIKRIDIDGQSYVAFEPFIGDDGDPEEYNEDEDSFVILKVAEEEGDEVFVTIDDDEEFDKIADIFEDELMHDMQDDEDGDGESENDEDDSDD